MAALRAAETEDEAQRRGDSELLTRILSQNFACVFGCGPSIGVKADTKMVLDVTNAMLYNFNRDTLSCDFPGVLDDLIGSDANFEVVASKTLQTLRLFYR